MRTCGNGESDHGVRCRGGDRRTADNFNEIEAVVLTRKYAEALDGGNLEGHGVGDRMPLRRRDARLLIAEGWAVPAQVEQRRASDQDRSEPYGARISE